VTALAAALPRVATGGPRFDRDRVDRLARDAWQNLQEILARACPPFSAPSPVREALAAVARQAHQRA
jgi:hypothetical protein